MSDFITADHVFLHNPATMQEEVMEFIAREAVSLGYATDAPLLVQALNTREAEGSTGMVGGIAIPHAKSSAVQKPLVMVLRFTHPIDWETMDKQPVTCAIALIIPDSSAGEPYLRLLSKLAVALMSSDFCEVLLTSDDAEKIADTIDERL